MMIKRLLLMLLCLHTIGCNKVPETENEVEPLERGPYTVGSTNLQVATEYADIGDDAMHEYLLGRTGDSGQPRYLTDILRHPESAFITDVPVPEEQDIYGPARGLTLPVVTTVMFPSIPRQRKNSYTFPYHDGAYGHFEDMLAPGETPIFSDPDERYPLIILAHGASAHGVYDVGHAHDLASHGYIVAVINYGDDRTAVPDDPNHHVSFLRPYLTKAVLDSILESEAFGAHVDADNIGISGHSFGGFTALAVAGGPFQGNTATARDERITAGVIAAPWVGGNYDGSDFLAFGPNNSGLSQVNVPIICLFGSHDEVTLASYILPAMRQLAGETYVVELVDQPHIFQPGSWEDRNSWELLFFSAYLKHDAESLETLKTARSMEGGNEDRQLFDYQKSTIND